MSKNKTPKMFFIYTKDFLDSMRLELKSERTISTYKESLNSFRIYMLTVHDKKVDEITFESVTDELVRKYTAWIAENNSVGTRNIRLSAIKSYLQYCGTRDVEIIPLQLKVSKIKHKIVFIQQHQNISEKT